MLVVEKERHINVTIDGKGAGKVVSLLRESLPNASFFDDNEAVEWKTSSLAQEIKASKTPGKLVRAYRERAGMTMVELAKAVETQYTNISAIENDRRAIGLGMARKLGKVLGVEFHKFLA